MEAMARPIPTTDRLSLLATIMRSINEDKIDAVKSAMLPYSVDERRSLVTGTLDGICPFNNAAAKKRLDFLEYMLNECGVRLAKWSPEVPPLWVAVIEDHYDVVKFLLEHGATVNMTCDGGHSPLHIAAAYGRTDIARCLIENCADVDCTSNNGETPLMRSTHNGTMQEYLIKNGADVNRIDNEGRSALYLAAMKGNLPSIQLLLSAGANPFQRTIDSEDACKIAVIGGHHRIVEHFLDTYPYPPEEKADLLDLLGAVLVSSNVHKMVEYWRQATRLRSENKQHCNKRLIPCEEIYNSLIEFKTLEDLETIENTYSSLWFQSMIVIRRILGLTHWKTMESLNNNASFALFDNDLSRSLSIYTFLIQTCQEKPKLLCSNIIDGVHRLFRAVFRGNYSSEVMTKTFDILQSLFSCVINKYSVIRKIKAGFYYNELHLLHDITVQVLYLTSFLLSSLRCENNLSVLYKCLRQLIATDPRCQGNQGLLHLISHRRFNELYEEKQRSMKCLLDLGADPNAVDSHGSTPLHYITDVVRIQESQRQLISTLIEYGAHLDMANDEGVSPLYQLKGLGYFVNPVRHTTLQCLAARCLSNSGIPFKHILPRSLSYYVSKH